MSPEQTRGAEVTRRSDVWAFGAVLFEMLSGRVAFAGPTPSDVVAGILQRTPDWSALPPTTPAAITRLLKRCLERESRARLHDIGDARLEIEDAERTLRDGEQASMQAARDDTARWSGRRVGWVAIFHWRRWGWRSISGRREVKTLARKSGSSWRRPQGRDSSACRQSRQMAARSCSRPFPTLAVTSGCGSGHSPPVQQRSFQARWVRATRSGRRIAAASHSLPMEDSNAWLPRAAIPSSFAMPRQAEGGCGSKTTRLCLPLRD